MEIMLQLGEFQFAINTAAYQALRRSIEYRWQSQNRLQQKPSQQYLGPGEETIELDGVMYPEFAGGLSQVEAMRTEAIKGQPLLLVDGQGYIHGDWCIKRIEETRTLFFGDGSPRKVEFRLSLVNFGEDQ